MLQRLKLLSRLHEVDLGSPAEALALLERVTTHTSSVEDRERLAQLIRVTTEVAGSLRVAPDGQAPPASPRLSPSRNGKRRRQLTNAARRRHRQ